MTAEPVQKLHELPEDALKAAFLKGWDACWCRKPNAPFERDGGRQTAWEKYRSASLSKGGQSNE